MKKLKIALLPLLFVISSCYIYKPYQPKEVVETSERGGAEVLPNAKASRQNITGAKAQNKMDPKMEEEILRRQKLSNQETPSNADLAKSRSQADPDETLNKINKQEESELDSLKIKIQPNQYYKITAEGKQYKIQADKWEGDTLVSHILRKPEKVLRFHKDQIDEEALMERRFSKPYSDLITVGAYVIGGAAVLLLVL